MCRIPGCDKAPGGGRFAGSFTSLCTAHRQRDRRHGDPMQEPIRAAELAPFIRKLGDRKKLRPEAAAWGH